MRLTHSSEAYIFKVARGEQGLFASQRLQKPMVITLVIAIAITIALAMAIAIVTAMAVPVPRNAKHPSRQHRSRLRSGDAVHSNHSNFRGLNIHLEKGNKA